jgi:uncharacterized protein YcnI
MDVAIIRSSGGRTMNSIRKARLGVFATLAAAALLFSSVGPASAHVGLSGSSTVAGTTSLLTFAFSHGCDGSGTTKLAIQIPAEIQTTRPGMKAGWTIERTMEPVAPAMGTPEAEATERVSAVTFTASAAVPDGFYDSFLIQVRLPEGLAAGTTLYFPTVQTCETGEHAWIQIPAEGQDGEELESPAPSLTITEAPAA